MFGLPDPLLLHHSVSGHLLFCEHPVFFFFVIFILDTWRPWSPPLRVVLGRCRVSILPASIQAWHEFASIASTALERNCFLGWASETHGWCWFRPFCRKVHFRVQFPRPSSSRSCRTFRCWLATKLWIVRLWGVENVFHHPSMVELASSPGCAAAHSKRWSKWPFSAFLLIFSWKKPNHSYKTEIVFFPYDRFTAPFFLFQFFFSYVGEDAATRIREEFRCLPGFNCPQKT